MKTQKRVPFQARYWMSIIGIAALIGLGCQVDGQAADSGVAIIGTTIIDVTTGDVAPDATVLIEGDRVRAIGPASEVRVGSKVRRIDGSGQFLIPGLWDMHVHTITDEVTRKTFLPLFIAHGVTGVRDMSADCDTACADDDVSDSTELADYLHPSRILVNQWIADIDSGDQIGPRFIGSSAVFDGPNTVWKSSYAIADADTARRRARDAASRGVDFLKAYSRLPREAYFALAQEAEALKLPLVGHLPLSVSFEEATASGQKSIEHMGGIRNSLAFYCLNDRESTLAEYEALLESGKEDAAFGSIREASDAEACSHLFESFQRNGTSLVPTLVTFRGYANLNDPDFIDDPRLALVVPRIRGMWGLQEEESVRAQNMSSGGMMRLLVELNATLTIAAHRAGVQVLAGSDTPNPFVFPGSGLHDELGILVAAGMTPAEALRSATSEPARFLGMDTDLGSIEVGKLADLVLLRGNPLDDIKHVREISTVIANGRVYGRKQLDQILDEARLHAAN